jgi:hypothetical protein
MLKIVSRNAAIPRQKRIEHQTYIETSTSYSGYGAGEFDFDLPGGFPYRTALTRRGPIVLSAKSFRDLEEI